MTGKTWVFVSVEYQCPFSKFLMTSALEVLQIRDITLKTLTHEINLALSKRVKHFDQKNELCNISS